MQSVAAGHHHIFIALLHSTPTPPFCSLLWDLSRGLLQALICNCPVSFQKACKLFKHWNTVSNCCSTEWVDRSWVCSIAQL